MDESLIDIFCRFANDPIVIQLVRQIRLESRLLELSTLSKSVINSEIDFVCEKIVQYIKFSRTI